MKVIKTLKELFCRHKGDVKKYSSGFDYVAVYECRKCGYKALI